MIDFFILILFVISSAATAWLGFDLLPENINAFASKYEQSRLIVASSGGFLGFVLALFFQSLRKGFFRNVRSMPTDLLVSRSVGLILGLLVANLLLAPILLLPLSWEFVLLKPLAAVISNLFFGIIGYNLGEVHGRTFLRLFNPTSTEALLVAEGILTPATAKILDTSAIIDGRIKGLLECGLLEGQVIIAKTVIDELQKLADSSNSEKRSKGRRGLTLLTELRSKFGRRLVVNTTKYEGDGTDEKLLKLSAETGGTLLTVDYNLAQVAQVQEINFLNLSDLVLALRPEVHPGEKFDLKIVREGKESNQGVGYLDDGTMVVIDGARKLIGKSSQVVITGELQTSTGRIIFGKLEKEHSPKPPGSN